MHDSAFPHGCRACSVRALNAPALATAYRLIAMRPAVGHNACHVSKHSYCLLTHRLEKPAGSRLLTCEADKTIKFWKEDESATPESHPVNFRPPKNIRRF